MRSAEGTFRSYDYKIDYPDKVALVFNPLYFQLDFTPQESYATVPALELETTVWDYDDWAVENPDGTYTGAASNDRRIKVSLCQGSVKVYLSRLFELMFTDPEAQRSRTLMVEITCEDERIFTFDLVALWGNLAMGERMAGFGAYRIVKGRAYYYRRLYWFRHYPFKLSLFHLCDPVRLLERTDSGRYSDPRELTFRHLGIDEIDITGQASRQRVLRWCWNDFETREKERPRSVFDETFDLSFREMPSTGRVRGSVFDWTYDYTFHPLSGDYSLVRLIVKEEVAGHYLRWVDRQGFVEQFLFTKGQSTYKTTPDSDSVRLEGLHSGMWFFGHDRALGVDCTLTHKACAVHLPRDIFAYVATVLQAVIVDRFLGYDASGEELWEPVKLASCSVSYDPKEELHDLEFSFTTPDLNAQRI